MLHQCGGGTVFGGIESGRAIWMCKLLAHQCMIHLNYGMIQFNSVLCPHCSKVAKVYRHQHQQGLKTKHLLDYKRTSNDAKSTKYMKLKSGQKNVRPPVAFTLKHLQIKYGNRTRW